MRLDRRGRRAAGSVERARALRRGRDPLRTGIVVIALIAVAVFFGFTKRVPFTHGFRLRAVFASAVNIRAHSPVRIAGVNVGQVTGIERLPGSDAAVVSMQLAPQALPVHADATLKIRPRIFLEGNFFVDMTDGSPSAHVLSDGATIPITQTSDPVQLDQVLTALNSDTRASLQDFLVGYGQALTQSPTAAQDAGQDREVRGLTGAQALNRATHYGARAIPDSATVSQALGGQSPHDVSQLVQGLDRISIALDVREGDLQSLISDFDTTLGALASQSANLRSAVSTLPLALTNADRALATLQTALPATRAFALALIPGVRELPATVDAALPWISETRALLGAAELGGLARELRAAAPSLGGATPTLTRLTAGVGQAGACLEKVLLPAANEKLADGRFSTGEQNYKEFFSSLVGLASEGSNFDGNGQYVHFLVDGGGNTLHTGPARIIKNSKIGTSLIARSPLPLLGTRPRYPATEPPYKPGVGCAGQAPPDLNGPLASGPADGSGGGG